MCLFFLITSMFICVFLCFSMLPLQGYTQNYSNDCSEGACENQGTEFGRINFILYLFFYTCNTQYPPVYILLITLKHKKERIFFFLFF